MPVKLNGATSGSVTLDVPAAAGTNTLTLPARTGTVITSADSATVTQAMLASNVAGNGPAFSAFRSTTQTGISSGTWTVAQLNATNFNLGSFFDTTTYKFTPTVAGYYQINGTLYMSGTGINGSSCGIYKNSSVFVIGSYIGGTSDNISNVSAIVYLNGTDSVELRGIAYVTSGTVSFGTTSAHMQFSGSLVRAA